MIVALTAEQTITDQLRGLGYRLAELDGAPEAVQLDAVRDALGLLCVVHARQAEQTAAMFDAIAQVAELLPQLGPLAEQLANGGPAALLGLLTGRGRK